MKVVIIFERDKSKIDKIKIYILILKDKLKYICLSFINDVSSISGSHTSKGPKQNTTMCRFQYRLRSKT